MRFGETTHVYARTRPVGGDWEDVHELDPGASIYGEDVRVAAAPGGEVVAVWVGAAEGTVLPMLRSASRKRNCCTLGNHVT